MTVLRFQTVKDIIPGLPSGIIMTISNNLGDYHYNDTAVQLRTSQSLTVH